MSTDPIPDEVVFTALVAESLLLGHEDPMDGVAWAVEQGYIEFLPDEPDDSNIRILEAGVEHVASMRFYPERN